MRASAVAPPSVMNWLSSPRPLTDPDDTPWNFDPSVKMPWYLPFALSAFVAGSRTVNVDGVGHVEKAGTAYRFVTG
jgi:hypothetical protein